ncbi:DUF4181 domain-containing protein [Fictibacillus sp. BK138]|uniref:DUF4181 domain-containing protein n=1 Tax=Fictibacillus sp. BK138 TaxID=2512121 RepID=UPI001029D649|nr:DUF4181 domain-containing protein [Fictibacillus sp. BK138]RZT23632.1 uncharacterized protein DUF4181 [Fictibacillus sp. BK138]
MLDHFLLNVLLLLAIYSLFIYIFNKVMRKWLKVEKKKVFSYTHVNHKHKKIDWMIRITFLLLIIISTTINIMRMQKGLEKLWFLETYVILFIFIIVTETARALMERKYAENRNDYKFTIVQLVFISVLLFLTYSTNFFWLV